MPYCWLKHPHLSKSERAYCNWLRARELAKEIKSFRLFPSIKLHVAGKLWKCWAADFEVTELDDSISIHESKGWNRSNDSFRLKMYAFLAEYPLIPLYVNRKLIDPQSKRISLAGLKSAKRRGFKSGYVRSWDRVLKRWTTIKVK